MRSRIARLCSAEVLRLCSEGRVAALGAVGSSMKGKSSLKIELKLEIDMVIAEQALWVCL